ncbi:hypothetical protein NPIL_667831 [Nephila pilipes]|uniref:Uncharacterized protein n=1 Tax=Nephila pilipes TaxID=299642 RepID=A0A8X6PAY5_NEPPI|nr:hypothetical protein NPIL_667831 [Nephila pilipes]
MGFLNQSIVQKTTPTRNKYFIFVYRSLVYLLSQLQPLKGFSEIYLSGKNFNRITSLSKIVFGSDVTV